MTQIAPSVSLHTLLEPVSNVDPHANGFRSRFKYIDIGAIDRTSKTIQSVLEISALGAPSRARQLVKSGDVLVSTVRPNLNAVAEVTEQYNDAVASTGFTVLRPNPAKLNSRYLYHWTKSDRFIQRLVANATGIGYPAVSDKIVKSSLIVLPTILEQERVSKILDRVDALRQKHVEAQRLAGDLVPAVFTEMFGDLITKKKIDFKTLVQACDLVTDGTHDTPKYLTEGIPLVTSKNLKGSHLDLASCSYISEEDFKKISLRSGVIQHDILLGMIGTIGSPTLVLTPNRISIKNVGLVRADRRNHLPEFLHCFLTFIFKQGSVFGKRGGSQKFLALGDLRNILVPMISMEEQVTFVNSLRKIERLFQPMVSRGGAISELEESIAADVF